MTSKVFKKKRQSELTSASRNMENIVTLIISVVMYRDMIAYTVLNELFKRRMTQIE